MISPELSGNATFVGSVLSCIISHYRPSSPVHGFPVEHRHFWKIQKLSMLRKKIMYRRQRSTVGNDAAQQVSKQTWHFRQLPEKFVWTVGKFFFEIQHLSKANSVFFEILHFQDKDQRSNYCLKVENFLQPPIISLNFCIYAWRFSQNLTK